MLIKSCDELQCKGRFSNMVFSTTTMYLTGIVVVLISFVLLRLKRSWTFWKRKNVPHLPTTFPFGNAKEIILRQASFGTHLPKIYQTFKPQGRQYFGFYFVSTPILIVIDPDLIRTITIKDFQHFTDRSGYSNEKVDPLTGHLFRLKGEKWKSVRAKLTPTFTTGKMKMMFPTLFDCCRELLNIMNNCAQNKSELDIKDVAARFTTDVIGSCAFGIDCNTLQNPNSEFRKHGNGVFGPTITNALKFFISLAWCDFLHYLRIRIFDKTTCDFFMNMVKETVRYREENNVTRKDFMHLLLQLKNNVSIQDDGDDGMNLPEKEKSSGLTIDELAAQAFVFFVAGFETSSTTLSFCFYELTTNLDIQEKLREEINSVLERHDSKFTYEALAEMTYMEQCLHETLRKYPPLAELSRECTKTYTIPNSGVTIEKGTQVLIPIMAIQRDPEYYPDPLKFDPERFSAENKAARYPFTWLPFGEGPRGCIGMRFGMMQAKVALAVLLKGYRFTLSPKTTIPFKFTATGPILSIDGKMLLNVEKI